jgi:hypothetical protein
MEADESYREAGCATSLSAKSSGPVFVLSAERVSSPFTVRATPFGWTGAVWIALAMTAARTAGSAALGAAICRLSALGIDCAITAVAAADRTMATAEVRSFVIFLSIDNLLISNSIRLAYTPAL